MKYLAFVILALMAFYLFSYAKFCWKKKNKLAAVGLLLLALVSFFFPSVLIIMRW